MQVGDIIQWTHDSIHSRAYWQGLVIEINNDVATIWRPTKSNPGRIQIWPIDNKNVVEGQFHVLNSEHPLD
jgi:hypothetical protein